MKTMDHRSTTSKEQLSEKVVSVGDHREIELALFDHTLRFRRVEFSNLGGTKTICYTLLPVEVSETLLTDGESRRGPSTWKTRITLRGKPDSPLAGCIVGYAETVAPDAGIELAANDLLDRIASVQNALSNVKNLDTKKREKI